MKWRQENVVEACLRFHGSKNSLQLIGGSYEHVFGFKRRGKKAILKLYPIAAKETDSIQTELEWMLFLQKNQVTVPLPLLSKNKVYIEQIPQLPFPFSAVAFQQIQGEAMQLTPQKAQPEHFYHRFGLLMGRMHRLAQEFEKKSKLRLVLDEWNEGEIYQADFSSATNQELEQWVTYLDQINQFPKTPQSYGLILNDAQISKCIFTCDNQLAVCDFTKIKKHWFAYDIAIVWLHLQKKLGAAQDENFSNYLLDFLEGYRQEADLTPDSYKQIQFFMEFRELLDKMKQFV